MNAETNIFEKMNQQQEPNDGKRLYPEIGNKSDSKNMHTYVAKAPTVQSTK